MTLEARGIEMRFGGTAALRGVDLTLAPGEVHALCGENGAGKSTLIKVLSGVHAHGRYGGALRLDGREVRFRSARDASAAGIAVIPQELSGIAELSVADNVCLGREPRWRGGWLDRGAARRTATEALGRLGVVLDPQAPLHSLGVGQRQLVDIARALARRSRILILDEPTAALSGPEARRLLEVLRELRAQGVACLYISHRLEEVLAIADRITVLRDGAAVATLPGSAGEPAALARLMVGRDVGDLYARPPSTPGARLLEVEALSIDDARGRARLRDVSFEVRAGEVLGLGGLMGAGRTELLMHLYGAYGRRRSGRVVVCGDALGAGSTRAALRAGLALVSEDRQRLGLHLDESVSFNLSLAVLARFARHGWLDLRALDTHARHWIERLGVRGADGRTGVRRLSGGNQQKVALGRALATEPRVVLLDEPTRGIDVGARHEIYRLVQRLTAAGSAVVLASSELPELIGLSDRIVMLRDGAVGGCFARGAATPERLIAAALGTPVAGAH